jgi:hypothetical protein
MSKAVTERRTRRPRKSYQIPPGPAFTTYTRELGQRVCEHVANGLWLREIAALPAMPPEDDLLRWFRDENDFRQQFTRAREVSAYSLESEAIELLRKIAKDPKADSLTLKKAEALAVQFRWSAERRNPAEFGYRPGAQSAVQIVINTNLGLEPDADRTPIDQVAASRGRGAYTINVSVNQRERLAALRRLPAHLRTPADEAELAEFEDVILPEEVVDVAPRDYEMTAHVEAPPPEPKRQGRPRPPSDPTWPQKLLPPLPGK